jgi:hypothetical protein
MGWHPTAWHSAAASAAQDRVQKATISREAVSCNAGLAGQALRLDCRSAWLWFAPILNNQTRHTHKLTDVIGHKSQIVLDGMRCD